MVSWSLAARITGTQVVRFKFRIVVITGTITGTHLKRSAGGMDALATRWVILPDGELEPCFKNHRDARPDDDRPHGYKITLVEVVVHRKKPFVRIVCKQTVPTFSCLITFETLLGYFDRNFRFNVDVSSVHLKNRLCDCSCCR